MMHSGSHTSDYRNTRSPLPERWEVALCTQVSAAELVSRNYGSPECASVNVSLATAAVLQGDVALKQLWVSSRHFVDQTVFESVMWM